MCGLNCGFDGKCECRARGVVSGWDGDCVCVPPNFNVQCVAPHINGVLACVQCNRAERNTGHVVHEVGEVHLPDCSGWPDFKLATLGGEIEPPDPACAFQPFSNINAGP